MAESAAHPRRLMSSVGAVLLGMFVVVVLSLGTDQALHVLEVYPPWGEPMQDVGDNLLALAHRCLYGILGSYLTARFAPHSPMRHVWVGGGIGFGLSLAGLVAATRVNLGPIWYPAAISLTALPCALLGGVLHQRRHPKK